MHIMHVYQTSSNYLLYKRQGKLNITISIFTIGLSPSWYLNRVTIKDIQTNQQWYFVCDNWLAVESEDGKICRVIPVANDQELTNFNQLFAARTVKGNEGGILVYYRG